MNKTELEQLQARLHMRARMVMDHEGRWVDPKQDVVVYRTGRVTPPETEGGTP